MTSCTHPPHKRRLSLHLAEPRGERCSVVIKLQIACGCGARLTFLGLPAAWLPDAPHPAGGEDDGTDPCVVYLPADWTGGEEG